MTETKMTTTEGLVTRCARYFFGDDAFISYARCDAMAYSAALGSALLDKGYACKLDQWGTDPGQELPSRLIAALKRSSILILISSAEAASSVPMQNEINIFKKTRRPIIAIDLDGTIESALWWPLVQGLPVSVETAEARLKAEPSEQVLRKITNAIGVNRKLTRQRNATIFALILFVSLLSLASLAGVYAAHKGSQAQESFRLADQAQFRANEAKTLADNAEAHAKVQQEVAREQTRIAEEETRAAVAAKKDADTQAGVAADARAKADKAIAQQRQAEAKRRGAITRLLTTRATVASSEGDGEMMSSIYLASESLSREQTKDNRSLLADLLSLSLYPQHAAFEGQSANGASFQPHGKYFALATGETVQVRDEALSIVREFRLQKPATTIEWSPDGKLLAGGDEGGVISIWEVTTGRLITQLTCEGPPRTLSMHPNGAAFFASCSGGGSFLWKKDSDWPANLPPRFRVGGGDGVPVFSPDGSIVAFKSLGGHAILLNYPDLNVREELTSGGSSLRSITFDPSDSRHLAVADEAGMVTLWRLGSNTPLASIDHQADCISDMQFSADGQLLVTACFDGVARVFEASTGKLLGRVATGYELRSISIDSSRQLMVTLSNERGVRFWRLPPLGDTHTVSGNTISSGARPYVVQLKDERIGIVDLLTGKTVVHFAADFSPDSIVGVIAQRHLIFTVTDSSTAGVLQCWDTSTGKASKVWEAKVGSAVVALSPNEQYLATASVPLPAFSGSQPINYKVWDVATGSCKNSWIVPNVPWSRAMVFTPNSEQLLVTSARNSKGDVVVLDLGSNAKSESPTRRERPISSAEFSRDGKLLALGDSISHAVARFELRREPGFLSVYEWPSAKLVQKLKHAGSAQAMEFSKDNRSILTVDDEGAKVWDIKSGSEVFRVRNRFINHASFTDDAEQIVVIADHPAIGFFARRFSKKGLFARRFYWKANDLLREACRVLPFNLNPQEWAVRIPEEPYHVLCPSLLENKTITP